MNKEETTYNNFLNQDTKRVQMASNYKHFYSFKMQKVTVESM